MALFGNKTKSTSDATATDAIAAAPDTEKKSRGMSLRKKDKAPKDSAPAAPDNADAALDFSDFSEESLSGGVAPTPATGSTQMSPDNAALASNGKAGRGKGGKKNVKSGTVVGLNIGNDSIKVIEVRSKAGEFAITGMGSVATPPESMSNGVVMSVTTLAHAVQDAFKQAGIKSRKVVSSVSGTGALVVRIIEVPKMSDSELSDNMTMDADRYIPFPVSEVVMDYKALRELPSDPDSPNMEVLLAAAQREIIDLHVRVLEEAKLDPQSIDVEPLAAARALLGSNRHLNNHNGTDGDFADYSDVTALLNIGASGTEISILRGDILVFTRTVPTGGYALTQGIVDYLGMPWEDAERLKCEMGDALPPHAAAGAYAPAPGTGSTQADVSGTDDWSEFGLFDEEPATTTTAPAVVDPFADTSTILDDFAAPAAPAPAIGSTPGTVPDTGSASGAAPAANETADPFDLDFFNQGPRNDEPTERNAQKEESAGDKPAAGFDFSSFSLDDEPHATAPSQTAAAEESVLPAISSVTPDGDDDAVLPVAESATSAPDQPLAYGSVAGFNEPPSGDAPSFMPSRGDDDEDLALLPVVTPDQPPVTSAAPISSAFDFPMDDADPASSNLPAMQTANVAAPPVAVPPVATPPVAPVAFQFGDVIEEPPVAPPLSSAAAPVATAEPAPTGNEAATPAAGFGFDFDALDTPAESGTSGAAVADPFFASTTAPGGTESGAVDDLDLDSLIGSIAAPPAATAGAVGMGTPGAGAAAIDAGFPDLSDTDDFAATNFAAAPGMDSDFGVDLESFGAGLAPSEDAHDLGVDAETLYSILHPILETLSNEVRRSLEYHASRYPDAAVQHITLVGGGAKLKNIDAYFTEALGIPTALGNPLVGMALQAPKLAPEYVESNGPAFATALGLALRDLV